MSLTTLFHHKRKENNCQKSFYVNNTEHCLVNSQRSNMVTEQSIIIYSSILRRKINKQIKAFHDMVLLIAIDSHIAFYNFQIFHRVDVNLKEKIIHCLPSACACILLLFSFSLITTFRTSSALYDLFRHFFCKTSFDKSFNYINCMFFERLPFALVRLVTLADQNFIYKLLNCLKEK